MIQLTEKRSANAMKKPSINWKLWRRMWRVGLSSYLLVFCTPWFLLLLSVPADVLAQLEAQR